jgi:hypothetical protein
MALHWNVEELGRISLQSGLIRMPSRLGFVHDGLFSGFATSVLKSLMMPPGSGFPAPNSPLAPVNSTSRGRSRNAENGRQDRGGSAGDRLPKAGRARLAGVRRSFFRLCRTGYRPPFCVMISPMTVPFSSTMHAERSHLLRITLQLVLEIPINVILSSKRFCTR